MIFLKCLKTCFQNGIYQLIKIGMKILLDKGIQGKEAKKVLPTLHKTPPNGTIGGVFVCGGKFLNPGPPGYAAPIVTRRYLQARQVYSVSVPFETGPGLALPLPINAESGPCCGAWAALPRTARVPGIPGQTAAAGQSWSR